MHWVSERQVQQLLAVRVKGIFVAVSAERLIPADEDPLTRRLHVDDGSQLWIHPDPIGAWRATRVLASAPIWERMGLGESPVSVY